MKRITLVIVLMFVVLFGKTQSSTINDKERVLLKNEGITFTENKGQVHDQYLKLRPDVLFSGESGNMTYHLRKNGISYQQYRVDSWKEEELILGIEEKKRKIPSQITTYRTDIFWLGTRTDCVIQKKEPLSGFNNYYNVPEGEPALFVKQYKSIWLKGLYEGIDMHYYGSGTTLKYDFVVEPNADYRLIKLRIEGAELQIKENGTLLLKTPLGIIEEGKPVAYQGDKIIDAKWKLEGNILSISVGKYNKEEKLYIDPPVREWGTFYGGVGPDDVYSCTTDSSGNVYIAGKSLAFNAIATVGAHQSTNGGGASLNSWSDAFLVKFNSSGVRQWGTYYGGDGPDGGGSCAVTNNGDIYLAGVAYATNGIATPGAHQTNNGGGQDCFLAKFNSSGVRLWGTYYGGSEIEYVGECSVDDYGYVYLCGGSKSNSGISTSGAHQFALVGTSYEAFLAKFNSNGVRQWGTYFGGGTGSTIALSCLINSSREIYLSGSTSSISGVSTPGAYQTAHAGGGSFEDVFLVKFDSSGTRLWGTYYGGVDSDQGFSSVLDTAENIYIAGATESVSGISTPGAHQTINTVGMSRRSAFLVKFNSSGMRQWATYYSGNLATAAESCTIDNENNIFIAGNTESLSGISTPGAHQTVHGGGPIGSFNQDAFLVKFNTNGVRQWGTYYGGENTDLGRHCKADNNGNIYMAGVTHGGPTITGISTPGAHQTTHAAGTPSGDYSDGFLVKFNDCNTTFLTVTTSACNNYTAPNGNIYNSSGTYFDTIPTSLGCDSIVTLNLTINNTSTYIDIQDACDSLVWIDGITYTSSTSLPTVTLTNSVGCDSIVTLNLTVKNTTTYIDIQTACNSLIWIDGNTYTSSTTAPTVTLTNSLGCDSVITLNLTINSTIGTDIQTACNSTYTSSTTSPTVTLINSLGCDSIVTLNLTILTSTKTTQTFVECEGFSIVVGSNIYSTSGIYTDVINNCDTIITDLTIKNTPQFTLIKVDDNCEENLGSIITHLTSFTPPITYIWNTGSTASFIDHLQSGTYFVTVTDSLNCVKSDTINVLDLQLNCESYILIPSVFTPNRDGQNDEFLILLKGMDFISLEIYNRWGLKLFESTQKNRGWDGRTTTGSVVPSGTYFFIVNYKKSNEIMVKKGTLTLIK
ncbi:MAG: gliding motility-associated C-terminal domain-containing protein [Bacteroidetes bacterium]|nr:gliding motility-associated C-terminal domain-containing protein [Bacteroidota bacterium]